MEGAVARKTVRHSDGNNLPLRGFPLSCLNTAARMQTYSQFFEVYLPHTSAQWPKLNSDLEILPETSWLRAGASVAATNPVLNDALTALSLAHIASSGNQGELLHASQALYVGAVGGVNKLLKDKTAVMEDTTLATVMALGLYEVGRAARAIEDASNNAADASRSVRQIQKLVVARKRSDGAYSSAR